MADKLSFNSLPLEIRYKIYEAALLENPIISGRPHVSIMIEPGKELLYCSYTNHQIAREACEVYYRLGAFLVMCHELLYFLEPKSHYLGRQLIDPKDWLQRIIIRVHLVGRSTHNAPYQLAALLSCPRLKVAIIEIHGYIQLPDTPFLFRTRKLFRNLARIVPVLRELRKHVRVRLCIRMEKCTCFLKKATSHEIDLFRDENVNCILDMPSEQTVESVRNGGGTFRERLTVLMATRWAPIVEP